MGAPAKSSFRDRRGPQNETERPLSRQPDPEEKFRHGIDYEAILYEDHGGRSFGVIFYGSKGYMTFPNYSGYRAYEGKDNKLIKKADEGSDVNHYQNFIDCVRDRDASKLNAPPIEGHYSSALSHYALTGARVNRVLEIDTETEMVKDDDEANQMLTREYREPFVVPVKV